MDTKPKLRMPLVLLGLCIVVPAAYYIVGLIYSSHFIADDFYISLRYARNLASGNGIVYNPGEAFPRSEGYTNFLLVLIQAFVFKVGLDSLLDSITWTRVVTATAMLVALGLVVYYCYQRLRDREGATKGTVLLLTLTTTALVATASPLVFYSVSGFETGLFAALVIIAVVLYVLSFSQGRVRVAYVANVFFLLATLTRPEGLLFWVAAVAFEAFRYVLSRWVRFEDYVWQRHRLYSFALFAVGLAIYLGWKATYYGDLLPLTFYAKQAYLSFISDKPQFLVSHRLIGGLFRFAELLSVDYNYLVVAGVAAGALGMWKTGLWRRLTAPHPAIAGVLLVAGVVILAVLLLRTSQQGDILGRWSILYFLFLIQATGLVLFGVAALASGAWHSRPMPVVAGGSNSPTSRPLRQRRLSAPVVYLGLVSGLFVAYVISNGSLVPFDDNFRLYAPVLPIFALLAFEMMRGLHSSVLVVVATSLLALSVLRFLFLVYANEVDLNYTYSNRWKGKGLHSARQYGEGLQTWKDLGKWLGGYAAPGDVLAVNDAGSVPYYSGLKTLDTWSLNDRTVVKLNEQMAGAISQEEREAIETRRADYIWQQNPRFFMYTSPPAIVVEDKRFIGNYCRVDLERHLPGISERMRETKMMQKLYQRSPGIGVTALGEVLFCQDKGLFWADGTMK